MIKVGDWVTQYSTGYWKVLEIIPKYADEDYNGPKATWKKGDWLGSWAILKKGCSMKMKPSNLCECVDAQWCKPVSSEIAEEIEAMFAGNLKAKTKFEKAPNHPEPYVAPTGMNLSEEQAINLQQILDTIPERVTGEQFWKLAEEYREYIVREQPNYMLYLFCYPWELDAHFDQLFFQPQLKKVP